MVEIRWLKEARDDLRNIHDFIAQDSKVYASRQIDKIFSKAQILKTQPHLGHLVEELNDPEIRELLEGRYRIIYRVLSDNRVDILMIHHSSRDLTRRFKA